MDRALIWESWNRWFFTRGAASKSMTLPCDIFGRMIREHNLIKNAFPVEAGTIAVPMGPGLGVELDRDGLDRYTKRTFTIELN